MKIKNKLLIFLGIFIFMIIPKNVFAQEIYPFSVKINNIDFTNSSTSYNGRISTALDNGASVTLSTQISSFDYDSLNLDYSFDKFPNIFIFFKTWNTPDQISVSKGSACNQSCFSYDGIILKQIGTDAQTGHYIYVMVLKAKKWQMDCGVGSGQCVYTIGDTITITNTRTTGTSRAFIFYSVLLSDNLDVLNNSNIDIDSMINSANQNTLQVVNSITAMQNAINSSLNTTTTAINNMNSSLTDETGVPNSDVSNKTSEWSNKLAGTGPVSQMVLMPITLLNGYVSGLNATCEPYNLGNLMGTDIVLPCITISNYVGVSLWNVIDILFSGFMIYAIGKKFVKIFNDFTNLRDNQMDELYGGGK